MREHLNLILLNIFSSVLIVGLNKYLFSTLQFHFPIILTSCHFFVTACVVTATPRTKKERRQVPLHLIIYVAICRVLSIMTMNLNLKINSVATYQLSKIAILPSIVLAKRKRLSVRETIGVLMATTGVYFATVRDPTIEMDGIYIAVVAVLTNVVSIMIGERVKSKGFGAVQVMRKEMPLSTILLMLTIPFTEESVSVVINEMTSYVMIVIVCTCICAAMINSTAFMMITRIGSISYLMCGHAKTLLVLSMGLVARAYGGTENDNDSVVGFWSLFAFCGVVIYSWNGATTSSNKKDE